MARMHFLLDAVAAGLNVGPEPGNAAVFTVGDVELDLRDELDAEGRETEDSLVTARLTRSISDDVVAVFKARLAEASQDNADSKIAGRNYTALTLEELAWIVEPPEEIVSCCADAFAALRAPAVRLVQTLRWLHNRPAPAQPLQRVRFRWSLDGERWEAPPPTHSDAASVGGDGVYISEAMTRLLGDLLNVEGPSEPLARQIFLEAVTLSEEAPRASLVLAVAAAEIGVKRFAVEQTESLPEKWLISKNQSPPLHDLLRDYLPLFTQTRTEDGRVIPKHLQTALREAVTQRNDIIHQGIDPPDEERLADVLVAVNDLLYLLDWLGGHSWAFKHLRPETQAAFGEEELNQ